MEIISLKSLGYPEYAIREDGVVINTKRISALIPDVNWAGYHRVLLYKSDGTKKKESVHRLVASSFLINNENKPCVNHKDSNPGNNHKDNLEWCTHKENSNHCVNAGRQKSGRKIVTDAQLSIILNTNMPVKQVKELTGLSKGLICYHRRKLKEVDNGAVCT